MSTNERCVVNLQDHTTQGCKVCGKGKKKSAERRQGHFYRQKFAHGKLILLQFVLRRSVLKNTFNYIPLIKSIQHVFKA